MSGFITSLPSNNGNIAHSNSLKSATTTSLPGKLGLIIVLMMAMLLLI
jgi:hypothetical protein